MSGCCESFLFSPLSQKHYCFVENNFRKLCSTVHPTKKCRIYDSRKSNWDRHCMIGPLPSHLPPQCTINSATICSNSAEGTKDVHQDEIVGFCTDPFQSCHWSLVTSRNSIRWCRKVLVQIDILHEKRKIRLFRWVGTLRKSFAQSWCPSYYSAGQKCPINPRRTQRIHLPFEGSFHFLIRREWPILRHCVGQPLPTCFYL